MIRLYVSAACGVSSVEEAKLFKSLGAYEVVAPYNLTPEEMGKIRREAGVGVEAFAHGHFDYHQCGYCWMSTYFQRKTYEEANERKYVIGSVNRGGGCFRPRVRSLSFQVGSIHSSYPIWAMSTTSLSLPR